ncbi:MAG: hypothetical protein DCC55_29685 [Chloroflexi bacterium]|nr:MAG: hypothetical protein DCC55_29685 [Chloroflexota bacterium]
MTQLKLLVAPDLHYCADLQGEVAALRSLLPPDEYDHMRDSQLFWHNELLVEQMDTMLAALARLAAQEQPDLLIFLGDVVNTNWPENVTRLAARLREFACPLTFVTGNHDIYLDAFDSRVQEAITPGDFATGMRYRLFGDVGLIFLDLFVRYESGGYHKWLHWQQGATGVDYRPQDVAAAIQLLADHPQTHFLVFGHFPMAEPAAELVQPGRKVGRNWPGGAPLFQELARPGNLMGIITGHQHFAHLQWTAHGFHWTLPALVEYPCAAAIVEVDDITVSGRLVLPAPHLAQRSIQATRQIWTYGADADRHFAWRYRKPSYAGQTSTT